MWLARVKGKETSPVELFRRYGDEYTRWPDIQCRDPNCGKALFLHGRRSLPFLSLGIKLPKGVAPASFNHYKGEGGGCLYAAKDPESSRRNQSAGISPEESASFRAACLAPENKEVMEAVLWNVLRHNFSDEVVTRLIQNADERQLWSGGFSPWEVGYLLLVSNVFDYSFSRRRTDKVRFVAVGKKGSKTLKMVFDDSGKWVRDQKEHKISQEAAEQALTPFRHALSLAPNAVRGTFRQITFRDVHSGAPRPASVGSSRHTRRGPAPE